MTNIEQGNIDNNVRYDFKILYAIGMVMVVANHVGSQGVSLFYELFPAYSFHLALFVFASGYFFKEKYETNIFNYIIKKVKSLLIPLYVWNCVYALIAQIMSLNGFYMGVGVSLRQLLIEPITNGTQYFYNLASWFVMPLFIVEILNVLIRKCMSFISEKVREYVYMIALLGLGMLGIYLATMGHVDSWWLTLVRVLHFIPFYGAGFFYKKVLEKHDKLSNTWYFAILILIQLVVLYVKDGRISYVQIWGGFDGFNAWPYIVGFTGIAFWLRVSKILTPVIGRSKIVNLIADNTFSIMVNQFLGFMLVKMIFSLGYRYTDTLFQDFSWYEYHTNIYYSYFPKGLTQFTLIYVAVAIGLSIIVQLGINRCVAIISQSKINNKYTMLVLSTVICIVSVGIAKPVSAKVENDGGVLISAAKRYDLNTKLSFSAQDANCDKYCVYGFSHHEDGYTWTDGYSSIMAFSLNDIDKDLSLNIDCGPNGNSQRIIVYVNNNCLDTLFVENEGLKSVIIPKEYLSKNTVIRLDEPDAYAPVENGDTRVLGIYIKSLELSEEK